MNVPHLLIHHHKDNVGVVVTEELTANTEVLCVITEDNSEFKLTVTAAAPLGHKIALADLRQGDTVIKYGEDIGKMTADVTKGGYVHVHNLKTKRW
ncbi:UxaA family hydrolase [Candidatus Persebacteraceae bacterium Df01]|jgi:(2R)-sulfolactate sulfo-lyase subunit alpha|uniref:UxaA family hydrolase n=1 Tax=Candidatus Doriopsillibacter californiensis TaxID=2970740 RepID=A0ABT7QKA4_9GAMM|nr:UxaA family hydrolase [Candidatus Persebacteraceae bacterium Df01]